MAASERDGHPALGGLVQSVDDGDGLLALVAVDRRRPAFPQCVQEVLELPAVALGADRARAACTRAERARRGGANGVVLWMRVMELPAHDAVVLERDGAMLAA